jgi:dTMP kinase
MHAGLFITFEGPEGSGKTTQMHLLSQWLVGRDCSVLATREPGGTPIGDTIRALLLDPTHREMQPVTETLLFSAARAQIVAEVIRPQLLRGGVVLCDRFADSTLAYQGYGRGLDLDTLRLLAAFATGGLVPDLTFCLDLPVLEGLRRKRGCDEVEWNRMEREQQEFHQRVRQGYLALAADDPHRWSVLDALRPVDDIQKDIRERVSPYLGKS